MQVKERLSRKMDELARESEGKQVKANASFFHVLYIGCHQVWPRSSVGLSTLNDPNSEHIFPSQVP